MLFTKLHVFNKETDNKHVPDSLLFERLVEELAARELLHGTHLSREVAAIIAEKNYSKALSVWIESLTFFKAHPERLTSTQKASGKHFVGSKEQYYYAGLVAYFLSLAENSAKLDLEFVNLIFADYGKSPDYQTFKEVCRAMGLNKAQSKMALNQWKVYNDASLDYNDEKMWASAFRAASQNKTDTVQWLVKRNLEGAQKKGQTLTPLTWSRAMAVWNLDKNYPKSLQMWAQAAKAGVVPSVEMWNQLLLANVKSYAPQKMLRIESVWKLLTAKVEPNAESYKFMVEGYISADGLAKAFELVSELKKNHPDLYSDRLREDLLVGLLENDHGTEAERLFNSYTDFTPSIALYNKMLNHFLKTNNMKKASATIDRLIASKTLEPDIATWTIVVDMLLKEARETGAQPESLVTELRHILASMKANGVPLNSQALTMMIANLMRDPKTAQLGWEFFQFMRDNNMEISAVPYTAVVYYEGTNGHMDRALELFRESLTKGIRLRPGYYNMILKGFADHPDPENTTRFWKFIKIKTAGDVTQKPNFYTFYYLLRQALFLDDSRFSSFVVTELNAAQLSTFGEQIPQLLKRLEAKGTQLPPELKKVAKSAPKKSPRTADV